MSSESATARLSRLLTMVPWLLHRQGVDLAEAAAAFGVSTAQIESDLALLFLCGTPGGMPDDLIDADWEGGKVFLSNADAIARPLRLGVDEALTLVVGLRTLASVPGLGDREVIDRTLAKLEETLSSRAASVAGSARIHVDMSDGAQADTLAVIRAALARRRRLHLRYLNPSRDETTQRDVDPMRLTSVDGRWYLEAWCHRSDAVRLFRLDRIEHLTLLDIDGTPPAQADPRDLDAGVFQPRPDDLLVVLDLDPQALWLAEYYPHERFERRPDGTGRLSLRTGDTAWLRRLVWRLGGHARVVEPAHLAQQVAAGAAEALTAYPDDPDPDREPGGS